MVQQTVLVKEKRRNHVRSSGPGFVNHRIDGMAFLKMRSEGGISTSSSPVNDYQVFATIKSCETRARGRVGHNRTGAEQTNAKGTKC